MIIGDEKIRKGPLEKYLTRVLFGRPDETGDSELLTSIMEQRDSPAATQLSRTFIPRTVSEEFVITGVRFQAGTEQKVDELIVGFYSKRGYQRKSEGFGEGSGRYVNPSSKREIYVVATCFPATNEMWVTVRGMI